VATPEIRGEFLASASDPGRASSPLWLNGTSSYLADQRGMMNSTTISDA
jgi:hypothetical protein